MPNSLVKNVLPIIFMSGFVRTNGLMNLSSETLLPQNVSEGMALAIELANVQNIHIDHQV